MDKGNDRLPSEGLQLDWQVISHQKLYRIGKKGILSFKSMSLKKKRKFKSRKHKVRAQNTVFCKTVIFEWSWNEDPLNKHKLKEFITTVQLHKWCLMLCSLQKWRKTVIIMKECEVRKIPSTGAREIVDHRRNQKGEVPLVGESCTLLHTLWLRNTWNPFTLFKLKTKQTSMNFSGFQPAFFLNIDHGKYCTYPISLAKFNQNTWVNATYLISQWKAYLSFGSIYVSDRIMAYPMLTLNDCTLYRITMLCIFIILYYTY